MNNDKLLYGVIGLVLGVLLVMGARSTFNTAGNMDRHFIEQMIPHHEDAITMANVALQKAGHQEIKDLARNIKKTQSEEIEWMEKWYQDWFGKEAGLLPKAFAHSQRMTMQMGMMGNDSDLERLENAQPFDKAFIEEMIPHHQMAVMMAQMLKNSMVRPEMKQLADDIVRAQTEEIEQMRSWYGAWYK
ncbi:MAG: DUF305 domain-containing protein [Candidatus Doudnabacteria bacterium]|nr:DUF305 domain-containing protein [Candidatus Doudnabacteria bacterium]